MVPSRLFAAAFMAVILAFAVACSTTPTAPSSPSAAVGGNLSALGDATLKVGVPTLVAPADGESFEQGKSIAVEFTNVNATYVSFAVAYEVVVVNANAQGVFQTIVGAGTTSVTLPSLPVGNYTWQVRGAQGDARGPWSSTSTFVVKQPVVIIPPKGSGPRTPDPAAGTRLPARNDFGVVAAVSNQYPNYLFNSCQDHGGTWDFMDTVIDTLRATVDTRYGYNWKRGVVGDPSLDIIDYNWSSAPDEGTRNVYTIDILLGHCGSAPTPTWINTQPDGGPGLSAWTGRGRF